MRSLRRTSMWLSAGLIAACTVPTDLYHGPDGPGDGTCIGSTCPPIVVADAANGLDRPVELAVNAAAIFWTERGRVRSCPLPQGCTTEPTVIADGYQLVSSIAVTDEVVYFAGCRACGVPQYLHQCPVSGCPEVPFARVTPLRYGEIVITRTAAYWRESTEAVGGCVHANCAGTDRRWTSPAFGGELKEVTTDGDTLYVKSGADELRTCPGTSGCGAPAVLPNSSSILPPFRVHAGRAYWLVNNPLGGFVRSCPLANCRSVTTLAAVILASTDIEVDDTGVYWVHRSTGRIHHCALTGCPPEGPTTLASARTDPTSLTLGPGFLYWIEGNTILKLAKPAAD